MTFLPSQILVSVPCHSFNVWAFMAMLMQVPMIIFSRFMVKKFKRHVWGNLMFWVTFLVFGQPLLILLYAHKYIRMTETPTA